VPRLAGAEPLTAAELAERTGTWPRYVTEWVAAQAASGHVTLADDGRFTVTAERPYALSDPDGPHIAIGESAGHCSLVKVTLTRMMRLGAPR
jgi:hypothetical protein